MHPLVELRKLVSSPADRYSGLVVAIAGTTIKIATPTGVRQASNAAGIAVRTGDRVWINGGVVEGKKKAAVDIPTYLV